LKQGLNLKKMKLLKITLVFLSVISTSLQAHNQESIVASGGDASGSGGSSSYSAGQVFYSNYTGSNGSETQGVQQADETGCTGTEGCTDTAACNFDPAADCLDDSCDYESCAGCLYSLACNYIPTATIDDGSCDFISCLGCTYQYAAEYDSTATIDDGSCSENTPCPGDFSGDGFVNVSDLGGFLGAFGTECD
jgi:hypothetical protein